MSPDTSQPQTRWDVLPIRVVAQLATRLAPEQVSIVCEVIERLGYEVRYVGPGDEPQRAPSRCPRCNGQGHTAKPPWIPGDVYEWPSTTTSTHQCPACQGTGVLR